MRLAIVHYGEDVPGDAGYRPLRYGQFARRWTHEGHVVTRVCPSFSHLGRDQRARRQHPSEEGDVEVVRTPSYRASRSLRRLLFLSVWAPAAGVRMRRIDSRVDAFLIGHPPPGTLLVYRLLRGRGPVVTDIRDSWFGGDRAIARALRTLARRELGLSNRVTALSRDVASWAELPPDDVTIVPIGVDDVPTPPHDSDDEGTIRCVFVGTINANFRLEDWVENWPRHDAAHLDIYGAGPNADRVEELSRAHPNVDFHGHLASDRVPEVLGRCDVGIAPTRPGFGTNISNKVAEYLAAGLLVLHSLEPEPSAVLAAHGLGESCSSDGSTLTDVLGRLATERDDLRSRRESRRRSSLDLLGWDRLATTMLGVMRDAIGTSP